MFNMYDTTQLSLLSVINEQEVINGVPHSIIGRDLCWPCLFSLVTICKQLSSRVSHGHIWSEQPSQLVTTTITTTTTTLLWQTRSLSMKYKCAYKVILYSLEDMTKCW